ncbi:MAG: hypothetical protein RL494_933, partial [Bacteroidota bacterium]
MLFSCVTVSVNAQESESRSMEDIMNAPNPEKYKELNLNNRSLTKLPPEIGRFVNLEKLWLNYNNLQSLPFEIGKLTKLRELYINNNVFLKFPIELGKLANLE